MCRKASSQFYLKTKSNHKNPCSNREGKGFSCCGSFHGINPAGPILIPGHPFRFGTGLGPMAAVGCVGTTGLRLETGGVGRLREKEEEGWAGCRESAQRHCRVLKYFTILQTLYNL
jgi:hypothetical protein